MKALKYRSIIRHSAYLCNKIIIILFLIIFTDIFPGFSQQKPGSVQIVPRGFYFDPLVFDPIQCQSAGSMVRLFRSSKQDGKIYIPVSLGFQQTFLRYKNKTGAGIELGMGAASFSQFEFVRHSSDVIQGQIINSDFKASGFLNIYCRPVAFRLQLFHESSHLADYYILKNNITTPNPGIRNYEQMDITCQFRKGYTTYYAGLGYVISRYAVRKRNSAEIGFERAKPLFHKENLRFIAGSDIKFLQENNYSPDIHLGTGISLGKINEVHWNIFIDYFHGQIPYSTLDYGEITWLGIGTVIIPASMK